METLKGLSRGFSKGPQSLQRTPNPSLPMEPECFRPKKAYKTQSEVGYCWWFRNPANQLRLVVYPIIYRNLYIPGGFCGISEPSTVWVEGMTLHPPKTYHPKYRSPQKHFGCLQGWAPNSYKMVLLQENPVIFGHLLGFLTYMYNHRKGRGSVGQGQGGEKTLTLMRSVTKHWCYFWDQNPGTSSDLIHLPLISVWFFAGFQRGCLNSLPKWLPPYLCLFHSSHSSLVHLELYASSEVAAWVKSYLSNICWCLKVGVSENGGTPKSSILIGISIINRPFWGPPIFGNTQSGLEHMSNWIISPRFGVKK